jgi:hypothetical protein
LGILPGIVGLIQAAEAVKLILGEGESLIGRLLLFNALQMRFRELKLRRDPTCPLCGENPVIRELIDYDQFCGVTPPEEEATEAADWEITVTENNWHTTKWLGTAARVVWLSLAICVLTVQATETPKRDTQLVIAQLGCSAE